MSVRTSSRYYSKSRIRHSSSDYPDGIQQIILASDIDETARKGHRKRLLRFAPAEYTTSPFVHDHWKEVLLLEGDLVVGSDAEAMGGARFIAKTYAYRPPGVSRGPFKSEGECVLFEIHYHDEGNA